MMNKVRVVFYGLGEMGRRIAQLALKKKGVEAVGAIDIAKEIVGKDLGDVLGVGRQLGVVVTDDPDALFSKIQADIAIHATSSRVVQIYPQISKCMKAGMDVISTCEELAYPYLRFPQIASEIDKLAKDCCVTVLGTGINPGYVMDTLPVVLTGICQEVKRIKVVRMMDSGKRRIPYQKKVGTGLTPEEFRKKIDEKIITGHVGLVESIAFMAHALGWTLDEIKELPPEPVIADREITTPYITVKRGQAAGLKSVAYGAMKGEKVIELEFVSHCAVKEEYDSVSIEGVPNINEKIAGGVHGDIGTAAVVVNMIPKVINAPPGFVTMLDLPMISAVTEDLRTYIHWRE